MKKIDTVGFILHSIPYKEFGAIFDVITPDLGKIKVLAKSVRGRRSSLKAMLQPYAPLKINLEFKESNLYNLVGCASYGLPFSFKPPIIFSALYVNELTMHLYRENIESTIFFAGYLSTISNLNDLDKYLENQHIETLTYDLQLRLEHILRNFEVTLLKELIVGLSDAIDCYSGEMVAKNKNYLYEDGFGFRELTLVDTISSKQLVVTGEILQDIHNNNVNSFNLKTLKVICNFFINKKLFGKTLNSRKLYQDFLSISKI